jgi:hypothetical protein
MIKGWLRMTNRLVMMLLLGANLISCGGGGGSDGGSGFVPAAGPKGADISISLTNTAGEEITEISALQSGVFRIKVTAPNGDAVAQTVISATATMGQIVPESATALTNDDGVATLYIRQDGVDGAGTLTATTTYNEVESEGSISYSVTTKIPAEIRKLGHIDQSGNFVEGVIKVEPSGEISPGGTAVLTLVVVDQNLDPVTTQESISFTSNCLFGERAQLDPPSPVALGSKTWVNYTARGGDDAATERLCEEDDEVTATLASSGAQAFGTVRIAPVQGEIIAFDEEKTTTKLIAIRGTGSASDLDESANVFFRVTDAAGNPVRDARVNFSLIQGVGDSKLACEDSSFCDFDSNGDQSAGRSNTDTAQSGVDGFVSTRVLAGSVAAPTQVFAYIDLNNNGERESDEPSTVSKVLVVSTGVADQNSISLSARHANPYGNGGNVLTGYNTDFLCAELLGYSPGVYYSGSLDTDGLCTDIFVKLADKFNNPVPDGTAATLTTEYGRILGSCLTEGGDCEVAWTSQNPRFSATVDQFSTPITINENLDSSLPNRYECPSHKVNHGPCPDDIADPTVNPPGAPRGGRSTLTLVVNGEESFVDTNGNGFYDEGERWTNLTEAFTDHNEDGIYTPVQRANCTDPAIADDVCLAGFEEFFYDFNSNGVFDLNDSPKAPAGSSLPDGLYNGVLCRQEDEAAGICSRELLHLSQSIEIILSPGPEGYDFLIVDSSGRAPSALSGRDYLLYVADLYNNPPPGLSRITLSGSGGCSVVAPEVIVPLPSKSRPGAYTYPFTVAEDPTPLDDASTPPIDEIVVTLTLPSGNFISKTISCDVERIDCNDPQFSPSEYCPE